MIQPPTVRQAARTAVGEHVNLRRLLAGVLAAFSRPDPHSGSGPDVVAARLDTLRGPLLAHFDEEERAGLFEQIEERAPEQATACDHLRREHRSLLSRLDLLRSASPVERRGPTWSREVRTLVDELARHERREADLLNRALDGSTPAAD
ncbi:MAG: hemerythrin domain-containing protein [Betaproteobacteria bacterium]